MHEVIFQQHGEKSLGPYVCDDFIQIMVVIFVKADGSALDVLLD